MVLFELRRGKCANPVSLRLSREFISQVSFLTEIYSPATTSHLGADELYQFKIIGFPIATDFHTLGLALDEATATLFDTNHAQAGSRIQVFKLDLDNPEPANGPCRVLSATLYRSVCGIIFCTFLPTHS